MSAFEGWFPKDYRAAFALVFTVAGGLVLTLFAWHIIDLFDGYASRLITELIKTKAANDAVPGVLVTIISSMAWGLKMSLGGLFIVIITLGFAVNRRSIKVSKTGIDLEGGDDGPSPAALAGAASGAVAGAVAGDAAGKEADPKPAAPVDPKWGGFVG